MSECRDANMTKIRVWTRQSEKILQDLERKGRYIVKKQYIQEKMESHAHIYLDVYAWYTRKAQQLVTKPDDVEFPIWVSLSKSSALGVTEGCVFLELEVGRKDLVVMSRNKWGYIVNYMYIPLDEQDEIVHDALLAKYQTHDTAAYLSNFYPLIKRKIIKSWDCIFEDNLEITEDMDGTLWEIKSEWIKEISTY